MADKSKTDETFDAFDRYAKGDGGDEALTRQLDRIGAREDRELERRTRPSTSPIARSWNRRSPR